ncbi:MAG: PD-(D/E)XK nuclease family protein [Elusimicrobiota bacterium]
MRALSHSSIYLYLDCPKKWQFKYVDKIAEKPKHFFSFGKAMHTALEYLYNVQTLPPPSLEDVLNHYHGKWISEGYQNEQQEAEYKAQGVRMIEEYYGKHIEAFKIPYFIEYGFSLEVDGIPVRGFVDRIDKVGDDRIAIVDYKTGKAIPKSRVATDAQLTMYQMACEQMLGLKVDSLCFYHLPSQTALTVQPHSEEQVRALRERIVQVAGSIKAGNFDPKPDERKCGWCDYKPLCPVFKHLYAEKQAPAGARPASAAAVSDEKLAKLVDRYGKLKEDIHEREAKAEELKKGITAALDELEYVRAFGRRYAVTAHKDDHWEFSKENKLKVLEVIRSAGFWDQIIGPLAPKVQKLLKDPNLPLDLRDRLQRLGHKATHTTLRLKKVEEEE